MMNIRVRKFIDTPFELTETPLLDAYLNFQFADKDRVIEFIYFMCGRALTKIEDRFMLFLYGQSGSGKPELLEVIKYSYGVNQVSNLKSSFEKTFGLSAVARSQIFVSDDMPINVANVFSKDNFLSMITRGSSEEWNSY
jgi:phage/plasmid-associated DNA primase